MQNKNQSSTVKNHGNICFARELRSFRNSYMYGIKIMLIALLAMKCNNIGAQTISNFAGTGSIGSTGMGGPATAATFYYPMGVVADASGNIYIADYDNNFIRKVNTSGIVSNYAGTGACCFGGDGGQATAASLGYPQGLAIDGSGNIYIPDTYGNRLRKISSSGIITTIAGNGTSGFSGDGGAATNATLNGILNVAVDGTGNVYFVDQNNQRIRKVNTSGVITTFAGNGTGGFTGDGGPATAAQMSGPVGIAVDLAGNVYVADRNNQRIRKINTSGVITTIAGSGSASFSGDGGPATDARLSYPTGVTLDASGRVYIADAGNQRIRIISSSGIISTIVGTGTAGYSGDGGLANAAMVNEPQGMCVDVAGYLYIADRTNGRVRKVTPIPTTPAFDGGSPQSLTVCKNSSTNAINSLLTITDPGISLVETYSVTSSPSHGSITSGTTTTSGTSKSPTGWSYTPTSGFSGSDAFTIKVTNSSGGNASIVINVTINALPTVGSTGGGTICSGATATLSGTGATSYSWSGGISNGIAFTPSIGTNVYTVTGTTSGCSNTSTASVIVNALPTVGSTGGGTICSGSTATLSGTGATSYSWTGGVTNAVAFTPSIGTNIYTVTGTTSGCNSTATATVVVNALPSVGSTGGGTICSGSTATLSGTGASSYSWSGGITNGSAFTPSVGTNIYTVTGTTSGCSSTATATVIVNALPIVAGSGIAYCTGSNGTLSVSGASTYAWSPAIGLSATTGASVTVSYSVATTYTVTGISSAGCSNTAIITTTVNPLPIPGVISGGSTIMSGGSTSLTETVSGGIWSSSNTSVATIGSSGLVTGVTAGTATISYAVTNICGTGYATKTLTVTPTNKLDIAGLNDTTRARIAYSLRRLSSQYTGKLIQVRRSSDNATKDIGWNAGGDLNTDTLTAFVGSGNGFITQWYDQSGNGSNAIQNSTSNQPLIVSAGTVNINGTRPAVYFNNGVFLDGSGSYGISDARTLNTVYNLQGATMAVIDRTTGGTPLTSVYGSQVFCRNDANAGLGVLGVSQTLPYTQCLTMTWGISNTINVFKSSVLDGSGTMALPSTMDPMRIGNGPSSANLNMWEITLFPVELPTNERQSMECNQMHYYNVTVPTMSTSGGATICSGNSTSLSASGMITYNWIPATGLSSTTGASVTASPSSTTVYTVIGTKYGCTAISTMTVNVNPTPTAITGVGGILPAPASVCTGGSITFENATTGGTWSASNGNATINSSGIVNGINAGVVNIVYTSLGCSVSSSLTVNPTPTISGSGISYCQGGSGTLSVSGATTYVWSPATGLSATTGSSVTASSLATTIYTVTGTNSNGCSNTTTLTVTVNPLPNVSASGGDTICSGNTATLSGTGASSYSWTGGITNGTPFTPTVGNHLYTVTGTDTNGCANTGTASIQVKSLPSVGASGGGTICSGSAATLSGTGAISYSWTGGITDGLSFTPAVGTNNYTVTGTDTSGCVNTATATIIVNALPTISIATVSPVCLGSSVVLSAVGAGTGGTYIWTPAFSLSTSTGESPSASPTVTTTYTATGTNATTGCTNTATVYVSVTALPVSGIISGPSTVAVGGNITLTDTTNGGNWISDNTSIASVGSVTGIVTGVASGTAVISYYVSNRCGSATSEHTVTVNGGGIISGPTSVCLGNNITLTDTVSGGVWSSSNASIATINPSSGLLNGVSAGTVIITYSVSSGRAFATVTVNALPTVSAGSNQAICLRGSANLVATGASTYTWMPSFTLSSSTGDNVTASPITNTTYTVVGTDILGCSNRAAVTVSVSPAPSIASANNDGPICEGTTLHLSVSGASNVTGYSWSGPVSITAPTSASATVPVATTSASGVYTVTINNGNGAGCTANYITYATVNSYPSITSANNDGPICAGFTLNLSVTGASNVSGYSWSGPIAITTPTSANASVPSATTAASGTYTVTINNGTGTGCTAKYTTTAVVNPLPATITGASSVCQNATTTLGETVTGGSWSSSNTAVGTISASGVLGGVSAGTVIITYTTINGCIGTKLINVIPNAPITGPASVCVGTNATLGSTVAGGLWSSSNSTVATINCNLGIVSGLVGGTSIITYTLSSGCSRTYTLSVISLLPNVGSTTLCTNASTTLTNSVPSGVWSSNNTSVATVGTGTGVVTGIAPGNVVIAYTVANGCNVSSGITVFTLSANLGNTNVCVGSTTPLSNVTVGGTWSTSNAAVANVGLTSGFVTGVVAGNAIITYTFGLGCVSTTDVTINGTPSTVTVSGGGTFCGSTTISASGGAGGAIYFQGTTSGGTSTASASSSQVVTVSGTYYFRSISASGCWGTEGSVTVLIPAIVGPKNLCAGTSATLTNSGGTGTWISSNTGVAGFGSTTGLVTAVSPGITTITSALSSGCVVTTSMVVGAAPAITGPNRVCTGQTITLVNPASGGTWTTSAPGTATVSSTGVVTGIAGGLAATISYAFNAGCRATYSITVNPLGTISNIIGGASPLSTCVGQTANLVSSITGGRWLSASSSVATIGTNGVVTGIGAGTSLISYIMPGGCVTTAPFNVKLLSPVTGPSSVCVGQSITLSNTTVGGTWSTSSPSVANVIAGNGILTGLAGNLVAPVTYSLGSGCKAIFNVTVNPLPAIGGVTTVCQGLTTTLTNTAVGGAWSSANSSIATITSSGIVTGLNPGLVNISYLLPTGCTTATLVNVNPVAAIVGPNRVCQGQTMTLTNSLAGTWSSGAVAVATIGTTGLVTGIASNSATAPITYTFCTGCKATLTVSVLPLSPIVGVTSLCQGQVITLTDASAGGTWSSSAAGIATFASTNGNVTGVSAGATTISYTLSTGCTATFNISVNPLSPITGPSSVCYGQSITLANSTPGGTWASPSSSIATISSGGVVTGATVANLSAIISYTTPQGCRATKTVTVNALPTVASLIGGPFAVSVSGAPITLTNTTTGGVWSSSNVAKATIGATTGVVTGVSVGSAIMTYRVTNGSGCSAFVSKAITVGPVAAPGNITSNLLTLNVGSNTEMNETINNGYWTCAECEGIVELNSENGAITGIGEGRVTITYTVTNEVITTLSVTKVIVNPKTDVVNNTRLALVSIAIMPNPNNGEFTIIGNTSNLASDAINLEVIDMLGQIVYRGQTKTINGKLEERVQLNNTLSNGSYLLNLHSNGEHHVFHFVVER